MDIFYRKFFRLSSPIWRKLPRFSFAHFHILQWGSGVKDVAEENLGWYALLRAILSEQTISAAEALRETRTQARNPA